MLFSLICVVLETFIHLIWHGVFLHAVVECFPSSSLTRSVFLSVFIIQASSLQFSKEPKSQDALHGRSAILRCEVSDPVDVLFSWTQDGRRVQDSDRRFQEGSNLKFMAVDRHADTGNFQCVASSSATGETVTSAKASFNIKCENEIQWRNVCVTGSLWNEVTFHLISLSLLSASQTESVRLSLSLCPSSVYLSLLRVRLRLALSHVIIPVEMISVPAFMFDFTRFPA